MRAIGAAPGTLVGPERLANQPPARRLMMHSTLLRTGRRHGYAENGAFGAQLFSPVHPTWFLVVGLAQRGAGLHWVPPCGCLALPAAEHRG